MARCLLKIEALKKQLQLAQDSINCQESQQKALLSDKEAEHQQQLKKLDDKIRRILAAKDNEIASLRGILRTKEAKLKASEDALLQINRELTAVKR